MTLAQGRRKQLDYSRRNRIIIRTWLPKASDWTSPVAARCSADPRNLAAARKVRTRNDPPVIYPLLKADSAEAKTDPAAWRDRYPMPLMLEPRDELGSLPVWIDRYVWLTGNV